MATGSHHILNKLTPAPGLRELLPSKVYVSGELRPRRFVVDLGPELLD